MKRPLLFLLLLLLYIISPTQICKALTQTEILNNKPLSSKETVTYPLHFISREETYDVNKEPPIISDINLIIIDSNGKIFGKAKTGRDGVADITVTVPLDKRYNSQIGTVTVIGYNNAKYKRTIIYEVPVAGGGPLNQNIYMSPRNSYRDEAVIITYGNMYHYFSKDLADKYVPWKN